MVSLDVRDELYCSICLYIYTDPVTLQCGHNFCNVCINYVLDTQKKSRLFSCPECRKEFQERPALLRNITLRNIAERFTAAHPAQEESGIPCTYCDSYVSAVKTCLLCEASLCGKHLKQHRNSPEHVLVEPILSLENRKCPTHKEVLKYYCTKDSTCICVTCRLDGNHQGHSVDSLEEAAEKTKKNLRTLLQNMTSSRVEAEKTVQKLQEQLKCAQDKAACKTDKVTAIFRDLKTQLNDLEKTVLLKISKEEKKMTCSFSDIIQELQSKVARLVREMQHIEELCGLTDAVTVLQESKPFNVEKKDYENRENYLEKLHSAGTLDDADIESFRAKLSDIIASLKKDICIPSSTCKLDSSTAAKSLHLSQNGKAAGWIKVSPGSSYMDAPERFQECSQVLGTHCFSSGQHYWEMQMSACGSWRIGVSYGSIDRAGDLSYLGCNDKSWCLSKSSSNLYTVIHNRQEFRLSHTMSCNRFRIWLDYNAGQLSFYELCNPVKHLHTFTAAFTEPLYPAFYVFGANAFVKITT